MSAAQVVTGTLFQAAATTSRYIDFTRFRSRVSRVRASEPASGDDVDDRVVSVGRRACAFFTSVRCVPGPVTNG